MQWFQCDVYTTDNGVDSEARKEGTIKKTRRYETDGIISQAKGKSADWIIWAVPGLPM